MRGKKSGSIGNRLTIPPEYITRLRCCQEGNSWSLRLNEICVRIYKESNAVFQLNSCSVETGGFEAKLGAPNSWFLQNMSLEGRIAAEGESRICGMEGLDSFAWGRKSKPEASCVQETSGLIDHRGMRKRTTSLARAARLVCWPARLSQTEPGQVESPAMPWHDPADPRPACRSARPPSAPGRLR